MWQVPSLSIAAQAFLFSAAFASDTPRYARVIVLLLGLAAVLAALQLLAKHRYLESLHGQVESLCLGKLGCSSTNRQSPAGVWTGESPLPPTNRSSGPLATRAEAPLLLSGSGVFAPAPNSRRISMKGAARPSRGSECRNSSL